MNLPRPQMPHPAQAKIAMVMQSHYHGRAIDEECAMPSHLEMESTLTDRYQTTVPETVRRVLKLGKRDKLHYQIQPDGTVLLTRATPVVEDDPVLDNFLGFLASDMANHPDHLHALDTALIGRLQSLVGQIDVDLDAPLSPEDE